MRRVARRCLSGGRTAQAPTRRPRFYERAGVVSAPEGGFAVAVDGRRVATPASNPLALPTATLALAVAAEWDAQHPQIVPPAMPLTSLAFTAVDQVAGDAAGVGDGLVAYATTDTCRFFADAGDEPEVRRAQEARLRPLLAWLEEARGVALDAASPGAFRAPPLSEEAAANARAYCRGLSHWELAALQCAVFEAKSFAIGAALLAGEVDAKSAEAAARIEESANIERWGLVEGAHDYDLARVQVQLAAAAFFAAASRGP